MDTVRFYAKNTKLIAHRGLSGLERENTAAAFVAAGNRDYFGIETDLHCTGDGNWILIHDEDTGSVAEVSLPVERTSLADLRALRLCGVEGDRADLCLATPAEYFRICKKYGKVAVLELKKRMSREQLAAILKLSVAEHALDRVIFLSFEYDNLTDLRALAPAANIQYLTAEPVDDALIVRLERGRFDLGIQYQCLTSESIRLLHDKGIAINCWTVDDPRHAAWLAEQSVEYITTNILQNGKI